MSISAIEARAAKVWFDEEHLWVLLQDGRRIATPLSYFPRLLKASPEARASVELSGGGIGLHWGKLDEDISVPGLLSGGADATRRH
ncbi:MAG: hypothetical protein AUJ52_06760 [Elusimicrobia bacterium CG1_02_63_36]|nr:MAG: hypothetical protein AUJ52_06760 [Elusimicrobia bacterium CG1_02_63_36]PIP81491.1 MAG: hypothetical protein COR54_19925 [Elusimicrobia bacterium CG22_combo_CG10-13_8_21_14_all_63_91]PJA11580.1 MAG: DUF2442 domain-containing protein [Elusimicrobia bacterium CG_4_10_14_0_2_um_filter_63_34]PJB24305.1 MAG: DUF2442 domain-containing protein [Elusimicrobia bacterium CG_4_9_14_3_um_filter_62_55]